MNFSRRLKQCRESRGLSRKALAELIGISSNSISNYENGISSPKEEIMLKLFDILQVEPNFLFQDSFNLNKTKNVEPKYEDEGIDMYVKLDSIDKAEIKGEMKHMLKSHKYSSDNKDYLMPIAAHNDDNSREQLNLMLQDIDEL